VCGPKLKNTSRTVKDSSEKVNRMHGRAGNAAEAGEVRRDRQARVGARMSPKQRLAVRQIDSAPLLSDLRNWFETARLPGRSSTAEAINYALNRPGYSRLRGVGDLADPWPVTAPWRIEPLEQAARSRKTIEPVSGDT
jgi:hypothetical protein